MNITDEGIRIECSFVDSLHRRNVILSECHLTLYEKHVEYKCVAEYESDERNDFEGVWTNTKSNYRWTRRRSDMSQLDMYYDNPADQWMVSIEFSGVSDPTGWLHDSPKDALKLYNQLREYMLHR
jgi:hypothetical protein